MYTKFFRSGPRHPLWRWLHISGIMASATGGIASSLVSCDVKQEQQQLRCREARNVAIQCFSAGLAAVDPFSAVTGSIVVRGEGSSPTVEVKGMEQSTTLPLKGYDRALLVAIGKAAYPMARAIVSQLGGAIPITGFVVTKDGHGPQEGETLPNGIRVLEASHPVPDERGVEASKLVLDALKGADERCLILGVISGGGSSLLACPIPPLSLEDLQNTTSLLLSSGASIKEINAVRKHLELTKGGRLAQAASPATTVSLVLSDVIGDSFEAIASGPFWPDPMTLRDCTSILSKYDLLERVPNAAREALMAGVNETPKSQDEVFKRVRQLLVASNRQALAAAQNKAEELGYSATILSSEMEGDVDDVAAFIEQQVKQRTNKQRGKHCFLVGGEVTVKLGNKPGKGGRNQEMAVALAERFSGYPGAAILAGGTDGTDGPTDAAGGVATALSFSKAKTMGIDLSGYKAGHDTYNGLARMGRIHLNDALQSKSPDAGLLITGPTGTNVMDITMVVINNE